jgi:hypothetical protein
MTGVMEKMTSLEKAFYEYHMGKRPDLVNNAGLRDMMLTRQQRRAKYGPRSREPAFCWNCQKSQHIVASSTPSGPRWRCKACGMWVFD